MNIHEYLTNKEAQLNSIATITENGDLIINYAGRNFTQDEFNLLYPTDVLKIDWEFKKYPKGNNSDKTKLFLHNKKSY